MAASGSRKAPLVLAAAAAAVLALALPLCPTAAAPASDLVWWEAESPAETNFPARTSFSASAFEATRHEILSGGDWLTSDGPRGDDEVFATWNVPVPADGEYAVWARKFWKHGPFRWRFDDGAWQTCGRDCALADAVEIRKHLVVNWVPLGAARLSKGTRTFEVRLLAGKGEPTVACFDCFVLAAGPFVPHGRFKPGETSGRSEPGWWPVEPPPDPFDADALDLRGLNEKTAGLAGFVRRDGDRLLLGDGRPVRFWGVNAGPDLVRLDPVTVRYLARRLAKCGVNLVRIHGPIHDEGGPDPSKPDFAYVARLQAFVAALRAEGIYSVLSFHFPLWVDVRPAHGLDGYRGGGQHPFALLFFDPRMQELWKGWARGLLRTPDPATGRMLAEDPAVAAIEVQNEDSLLFHTFNPGRTIPLARIEGLERAFGAWLAKRHGSCEKAVEAWDGARRRRDDPDANRMELMPAWNLTGSGHGEGAARRRASDQLRFMAEVQHRFHEEAVAFLRTDLGSKSLVVCGNWQTADPRVLDGIERWSYTPGDLLDQHGYFGGNAQGDAASYAVRAGQTYRDQAALLDPAGLPLAVNSVEGFPHGISEVNWANPNRFRAEFPLLAAATAAHQGVDALELFALNGPSWSGAADKFPLSTPLGMGQFPACALLYRRGDVREGEVVFHESLDLEQQYDFRGSAAATPQALDDLRKEGVPPGGTARGGDVRAIDPLAWLVGRVTRSFDGKPARSFARDLSPFIDRGAGTVKSASGEMRFDTTKGVAVVDTARAQGAAGALGKAGVIVLGDVTIECRDETATVLVVSLDDAPISTSKRVLVQCATEEKPYGWKVEAGRIADAGGPPLLVREAHATVTFKGGARLAAADVLDLNGTARGQAKRTVRGADVEIEVPPDALWTILR